MFFMFMLRAMIHSLCLHVCALPHFNMPELPALAKHISAANSKLCYDFEHYCRQPVVCGTQMDVWLIIKVCQHSLASRYQRHFSTRVCVKGCWGYCSFVVAR